LRPAQKGRALALKQVTGCGGGTALGVVHGATAGRSRRASSHAVLFSSSTKQSR